MATPVDDRSIVLEIDVRRAKILRDLLTGEDWDGSDPRKAPGWADADLHKLYLALDGAIIEASNIDPGEDYTRY